MREGIDIINKFYQKNETKINIFYDVVSNIILPAIEAGTGAYKDNKSSVSSIAPDKSASNPTNTALDQFTEKSSLQEQIDEISDSSSSIASTVCEEIDTPKRASPREHTVSGYTKTINNKKVDVGPYTRGKPKESE